MAARCWQASHKDVPQHRQWDNKHGRGLSRRVGQQVICIHVSAGTHWCRRNRVPTDHVTGAAILAKELFIVA